MSTLVLQITFGKISEQSLLNQLITWAISFCPAMRAERLKYIRNAYPDCGTVVWQASQWEKAL
jgi:hypothetical protein